MVGEEMGLMAHIEGRSILRVVVVTRSERSFV
jgi:hypothetical protein